MAELNCQMHVKTATDYDDIYLTSKSQLVEYDNTTSGLSATNTKGAIDELASEKLDKVGDAKDTTVTFTEASTLANIVSGESATTLWGKVMKFMSILGTGLNNVAPVYSASSTYGIGAFVLNNNKLYRCSIAISTPEAFNIAKWTSITLIDFLTVQTFAASVSNPVYGTNNSSILSKVGKLVTFNIFYNNNISAISTGSPIIFTLPIGSRPATQTFIVCRCLNNPSVNSIILACRTDGTVTYEDNIGAPLGCFIDGSVTFVTNQ